MRDQAVNHRREVTGVVFLAFAIILGVSYYLPATTTGMLGEVLRSLGKGLFGVSAYVFPVLFTYAAIDFFLEKRQNVAPRRVMYVLFLLLAVSAVFPAATVKREVIEALCLDATKNQALASKAFTILWQSGIDPSILRGGQATGANILTGGVIGGGIALGLSVLAAKIGALILLSAFMLAQIVLIFNLSITRTATRTAEAIRTTTKRASGAIRSGADSLRAFSRNVESEQSPSDFLDLNPALPGTQVEIDSLPLNSASMEDFYNPSLAHDHPGFIDLEGTETPMTSSQYNPYDMDLSNPPPLNTSVAMEEPDPFVTETDAFVRTDFLKPRTEPLPTSEALAAARLPKFLDDQNQTLADIQVYRNEQVQDDQTGYMPLRRIGVDGQEVFSANAEEDNSVLVIEDTEEAVNPEDEFTVSQEVLPEVVHTSNAHKVTTVDGITIESGASEEEVDYGLTTDRETLASAPVQARTAGSFAPGQQLSLQFPKPSYKPAPSALLRAEVKDDSNRATQAALLAQGKKLEDTLASFGVAAKVINVTHGPAITRFELTPGPGIKVSRIVNLSDDLALAMAAMGVRIEAPIPGKSAIGIEIPNQETSAVTLRSLLDTPSFKKNASPLVAALGRDIPGNPIFCDLAKMPHLLIAGATGSGKSVCINSILISILCKSTPDEVKLLMIDPKVVELSIYNGIPHLLAPVVTDPKKAANTLNWAVGEMTRRYGFFAESSVRDFRGYNEDLKKRKEPPLPLILIVIDELADLMQVASKEVEESIARLTAMARAAGIHLLIATQRPSVDVITGVIKANIPSRIAFAVSSQVDSRTILDMVGAEKLLGKGDMLYYPQSAAKPQRGQGAFVSDGEVESVIEYWKKQNIEPFDPEEAEAIMSTSAKGLTSSDNGSSDEDELLPQAVEIVLLAGCASVSILQRRMNIGYPRAARLIDRMQDKGYVGPFEGSKPRKLLINQSQWLEIKAKGGS